MASEVGLEEVSTLFEHFKFEHIRLSFNARMVPDHASIIPSRKEMT